MENETSLLGLSGVLRLHICNVFFEKELEKGSILPLADWIRSHPAALQLQFLPLLYAGPQDRILVSDLPENPDPRLRLIQDPIPPLPIEDWGPSRSIFLWSQKNCPLYSIPDWETVRRINSKIFSFTESSRLPGSAILETREELKQWLKSFPGAKVLKTPFGVSGSGHCLNPEGEREYRFPLIGEPWVERELDFSSQWKEGKLLGTCVFQTSSTGVYQGTIGSEVDRWALEEHLAAALPVVEKIGRMGYSGHLGIDAFIYRSGTKKRLHPIVEINARKTMSWIALQLPGKKLHYVKGGGILPKELLVKGKKVQFPRNIRDS